jgi:type IV secretion system protein TrbL
VIALGKSDIGPEAIKKLFITAFSLWLITNMHWVTNMILRNFAHAGLVAGGSAITQAQIFDPSAIIGMGLDATQPIFEDGGFSINVFNMFMKGIAGLMILGCFAYIAFQLFLSILEFYIITVVSVILVPFGLFRPLSFLFEKSIVATFALALRFMILAFVVCLSYKTLQSLKLDEGYTFVDCVNMLVASGMIAFLCGSCTRLAAVYFGGGIGMSGGLFTMAVAGLLGGSNMITKAASEIKDKFGKGGGGDRGKNESDSIRQATSAHVQGGTN